VTLSADKKQIAWLIGIVVFGGAFVWYENSGDSPAPTIAPPAAPSSDAATPAVRMASAAAPDRRRVNHNQASDFQPRFGPRTPEERLDPATVDPTLRLDLLAKVQNVELGPPGRNLFDFGSAPLPVPAIPKNVPTIAINHAPSLPGPSSVTPAGPPPPPSAPPMTFKYYGYKISSSDGHKAAFLLDGDDILVAGENDTVKRRYRVVRIGVNSITIEDTQFKSTQTLLLQESPTA
jgi:hypothetical protein